jgi:hypothetical protein
MRTIAKLFGKSPFAPLQAHMSQVADCVELLGDILPLALKGGDGKLEKTVDKLCRLEQEADVTKNDLRNHLPKSLFLPIDRGHFLEILAAQDAIADKAEEIALLLALRPLEMIKPLSEKLPELLSKNLAVFWAARQIVREIDALLESSFGGLEAEKVRVMVEKTALLEDEGKEVQRPFLREFFKVGDGLTPTAFTQWIQLIEKIGELSHLSERLANRIRMVLELK